MGHMQGRIEGDFLGFWKPLEPMYIQKVSTGSHNYLAIKLSKICQYV